jgi:tetratricopeptide (TPR) repeat protein
LEFIWARLAGLCLARVVVGAALTAADTAAAPPNRHAERAYEAFQAHQARFQLAPSNAVVAWQFGRVCFDWAEFATNDTQRATVAEAGIAACRAAVQRAPEDSAAHYYLGMNLGQLARTKSLGALPLVWEMEREFKRARELDPRFDYAGPDRCLGLLYLDAPAWPVSVGSQEKARLHLRRAVELSPDYPENRLNLLEASLRWKHKQRAQRELEALEGLLPRARTNFSGESWAYSWLDWDKRWQHILVKARPAKAGREKKQE